MKFKIFFKTRQASKCKNGKDLKKKALGWHNFQTTLDSNIISSMM